MDCVHGGFWICVVSRHPKQNVQTCFDVFFNDLFLPKVIVSHFFSSLGGNRNASETHSHHVLLLSLLQRLACHIAIFRSSFGRTVAQPGAGPSKGLGTIVPCPREGWIQRFPHVKVESIPKWSNEIQLDSVLECCYPKKNQKQRIWPQCLSLFDSKLLLFWNKHWYTGWVTLSGCLLKHQSRIGWFFLYHWRWVIQ